MNLGNKENGLTMLLIAACHNANRMLLKPEQNLYSLLTAAALLVVLPGADAHSATGNKKLLAAFGAPNQMVVERTVEGSEFIQEMANATSQLKGYSFDYETTVFKGNKTIDQKGSFWFKAPPRMLRVIMTGNYKKGAVAVLGRDGKVRGHLGGLLGAVTITIDPNSDMLLGANGYPLLDSDFASMSTVIKKFLSQGCKAKVTDHPVAVEGQTKKVYVLEIMRPNGTELYKRTYIDPQNLLPLEWFDYQDGKLFAHTVWTNLKIDPGIKDDLFNI
jgi:outer membrane lipoprotein-sorting protein